jgi:diguanylate cyclase (GGDEF)-like protein/PAS domain S-box-containing protein
MNNTRWMLPRWASASLGGAGVAAVMLLLVALPVVASPTPITLGILAARSAADTERSVAPLVHHLEAVLPDHPVQVRALDWDALEEAVVRGEVDFVLTNPLQFVELRYHKRLSGALATRVALEAGHPVDQRGAVVVRRADRTDLNSWMALGSKPVTIAVAAVHSRGQLSYMAPLLEMLEAGARVDRIRWLETGARQEAVLAAVRDGRADVGFVRTGLLEEQATAGQVVLGDWVVVNPLAATGYPVALSTRLYPDWALAALPHVSAVVSRKVTAAALSLEVPAATSAATGFAGFTIPAEYGGVEAGMRQLRMSPFDAAPAFTLDDVWRQYRWALIGGALGAGLLLLVVTVLVRTQRQRAQVLDNMSDGLVRLDRAWRYTYVNRQAQKLLGQSWAELRGRVLWDVFPESVGHPFQVACIEAMESEQARSIETNFAHWGRWFENRIHPDAQGVSIFFTDITRRKGHEVQLQEREQHFRTVANGGVTLIWTSDVMGRCGYFNEPWLRFTGRTLEQELNDGWQEGVHPDDRERCIEQFKAAFGARQTCSVEYRLRHVSGEYRWLRVDASPRFSSVGRFEGFLGFCYDITVQRITEQALQRSEERHRAIVQALPDVLFRIDAQGTILDFQTGNTAELFMPPEAFLGQRIPAVMPASVAEPVMAAIRRTLVQGGIAMMEYQLPMPGGVRHYEMRLVKVGDDEVLTISRNITDRVGALEAQRLAASVFDSAYDGIMITDPNLRIVQVNAAFTRITGYEADDVKGQRPSMLASGRHDGTFYRDVWNTLRRHGTWQGEVWNRRQSGEVFVEMLSVSSVRDPAGQVTHYVGVFSDISERKAHEAELNRIAYYDPLTGVPNRRLLVDRLSLAVDCARRDGHLLAVCYLDVDDFKPVNDRLGHAAGDRLLVELAQRLQGVLGADDTLARLGGDEFVVLSQGLVSQEDCERLLNQMLTVVHEPMELGVGSYSAPVQISVSVGVALFPSDDADPDTLLRHADQAMYRAKEQGRNRFHFFSAESDRDARTRRDQLTRLRQALHAGELLLYYQPKVDLHTREVVGVEALIRWQHPEQGLLPPGLFLTDLVEGELEVAIGEWVIATALTQCGAWLASGRVLPVSVNLSGYQLLRPDFAERLRSVLAEHSECPPAMLEIEILESAAVSDVDRAADVMGHCRELGVQFALDDFGTGYSSLSLFRRLPVHTVKIDQSFVREMLDSDGDRGIVESVVHLADAFGRAVIAEGVETVAHGLALQKLGCRLAQGYGIARPMPAAEVPAWCERWARVGTSSSG